MLVWEGQPPCVGGSRVFECFPVQWQRKWRQRYLCDSKGRTALSACGRLWQIKQKRVFSLYLSPAFDIGACQGILELLNTRGHGWQRWCPCLLVSILVARRGFGQCVCINRLLESVQSGLSSSKCKRSLKNHLSTLSGLFRVCLALQ